MIFSTDEQHTHIAAGPYTFGPPYWRNEDDWIVLIEFLRREDD
jgi:hypothetical protein